MRLPHTARTLTVYVWFTLVGLPLRLLDAILLRYCSAPRLLRCRFVHVRNHGYCHVHHHVSGCLPVTHYLYLPLLYWFGYRLLCLQFTIPAFCSSACPVCGLHALHPLRSHAVRWLPLHYTPLPRSAVLVPVRLRLPVTGLLHIPTLPPRLRSAGSAVVTPLHTAFCGYCRHARVCCTMRAYRSRFAAHAAFAFCHRLDAGYPHTPPYGYLRTLPLLRPRFCSSRLPHTLLVGWFAFYTTLHVYLFHTLHTTRVTQLQVGLLPHCTDYIPPHRTVVTVGCRRLRYPHVHTYSLRFGFILVWFTFRLFGSAVAIALRFAGWVRVYAYRVRNAHLHIYRPAWTTHTFAIYLFTTRYLRTHLRSAALPLVLPRSHTVPGLRHRGSTTFLPHTYAFCGWFTGYSCGSLRGWLHTAFAARLPHARLRYGLLLTPCIWFVYTVPTHLPAVACPGLLTRTRYVLTPTRTRLPTFTTRLGSHGSWFALPGSTWLRLRLHYTFGYRFYRSHASSAVRGSGYVACGWIRFILPTWFIHPPFHRTRSVVYRFYRITRVSNVLPLPAFIYIWLPSALLLLNAHTAFCSTPLHPLTFGSLPCHSSPLLLPLG